MSATLADTLPQLPSPTVTSAGTRWAGRVVTTLAVLFLAFDVAVKLMVSKEAIEGTAQLGWSPSQLPVLGGIELACLVLYLIPRTAPLGAVLWTGYLGGAIATHLRVGNPLFTHTLFPVYVAALVWGGLYLRDRRVRALFGAAR
jgi:DoxX-like protein